MLADHFGCIVSEISDESKKIRFWLKLPPIMTDDSDQVHQLSPNARKYIPQSRIAQQLNTNLSLLNDNIPKITEIKFSSSITSTTTEIVIVDNIPAKNKADNHSESKNNNYNKEKDHGNKDNNILDQKFDVLGSEPSKIIIDTFRQLYHKYIKANNAVFEVNISSLNRNILMKSFDTKYYHSMEAQKGAIGFIHNLTHSFGSGKDIDDAMKMVRSFINAELDDYVRNLDSKSMTTQKQVLKWLLMKIMGQFELSVKQIAFLMNDSFGRFQRTEQDMFEKLCRLSQV